MLRVLRSLNGLIFVAVSCAALAQPSSSPAPSPPPPAAPASAPPAASAAPAGAAPAAAAPASSAAAAAAPAPPAATIPLAPTGGTAPPLQACAVKAFDDYAVAMSLWEHDWAEGVLDARPDFNDAVIARGNAHNSALQRDGYRIHYLAANAPDSLNVDESIASMRLFDWTAVQEQTLRLTQPGYAAVADAADRDRQAADDQPKSEELETYFEESFTDNAGAGAARKLAELLGRGNGALEFCREHLASTPPSATCPSCYSGPEVPPGSPAAPAAPATPATTPPAKP